MSARQALLARRASFAPVPARHALLAARALEAGSRAPLSSGRVGRRARRKAMVSRVAVGAIDVAAGGV